MNKRIIKFTFTLAMLLMIAAPTQAFAAGNYSLNTSNSYGSKYSAIYQQYMKQLNSFGIKKQPPQQWTQTAPATQAPNATESKPAAASAAPAATAPVSANIGAYEQQVVDLVNKERAAAGLPALKVNTKLAGVAEKKAEDLRDKGYFAHQSPTYGSPFDMMKQFGIQYSTAGENIAKGQKTPGAVMDGWMNSAGHKANILNANYTEIGVGYVTDSNGGTYWVQMFIKP